MRRRRRHCARLEALLAAHEQPATELALPVAEAASTAKATAIMEQLDEAVGQTLGRYKLLERVGEGGCGMVYVAEQTKPVRRRVALKVIKLDVDTRSDIYSLGVLLYQLLTNKTPFDGKELLSMGIDAMRRAIREKEPMRPSTRLTQALVATEVTRGTPGDGRASASFLRRTHQKRG